MKTFEDILDSLDVETDSDSMFPPKLKNQYIIDFLNEVDKLSFEELGTGWQGLFHIKIYESHAISEKLNNKLHQLIKMMSSM